MSPSPIISPIHGYATVFNDVYINVITILNSSWSTFEQFQWWACPLCEVGYCCTLCIGNPALYCLQSRGCLLFSSFNVCNLIWGLINICYKEVGCYSGVYIKVETSWQLLITCYNFILIIYHTCRSIDKYTLPTLPVLLITLATRW